MKKRFAAVDTHFLLALFEGDENCQAAVDWLTANNIFVVVTSCVRQELFDMSSEAEFDEDRRTARETLGCITSQWGFLPIDPLSPTDYGIAHILAQKILDSGVLGDVDGNASLVLVEAAMENCAMFITTQPELVSADWNKLRMVMLENELPNVVAMTPEEINHFVSFKMQHVSRHLSEAED